MLNNKTWYTVKFKGTWVINMLNRPYQISRWGSKFQIYVDKRNELLKSHKDWISNDLTWIKLIWNKLVKVQYKCWSNQMSLQRRTHSASSENDLEKRLPWKSFTLSSIYHHCSHIVPSYQRKHLQRQYHTFKLSASK